LPEDVKWPRAEEEDVKSAALSMDQATEVSREPVGNVCTGSMTLFVCFVFETGINATAVVVVIANIALELIVAREQADASTNGHMIVKRDDKCATATTPNVVTLTGPLCGSAAVVSHVRYQVHVLRSGKLLITWRPLQTHCLVSHQAGR
jgi:hypothetical protein